MKADEETEIWMARGKWHDGVGSGTLKLAVLWRANRNMVLGTGGPRGDESWICRVVVAAAARLEGRAC